MTTLQHEIRIDAPPERVWDAISDLTGVARYNPHVVSARLVGARPRGVGAARRCQLRPKGWVEERVWEWEPPTSLGLEVSASEWPVTFMKWRTVLRPEGARTVVTQEMRYTVKFGPLGALLDALVMRRTIDRTVRAVFEGLKHYVERARAA